MILSIALCTYQGERWLPSFLDGLVGQHRLPDELVVSDDGSSDATLEQLTDFRRGAPFPVEISTAPRRLGSTMNFARAFEQCAGELIFPADQDDVWHPEKLERLEAAIEGSGAAVGFCDGRVIDERGGPTGQTLWAGVGFTSRRQAQFDRRPLALLLKRSVVTGAAMVFHRRLLELALPFPAALDAKANPMLQDRWISLLAAGVGSLARLAEPLLDFRQHPGQQTGLRSPLRPSDVVEQARRRGARADLQARIDQLSAVSARLAAASADDRVLTEVSTAVDHLRTRVALPDPRPARLAPLVREVATGRYWRYSGGWRSAAADLVRPAPA